jgi:hypothetical protein
MNEQEQLYEAFLNVINEAAEPKFKVGDQVGIGSHHYSGGHSYHGADTGTVTKVNKFGHHTVEYHNRKSSDDPSKPLVKQFDASGKSRDQYSDQQIIPKTEHDAHVKATADKQERSRDLHAVARHLEDHRLGTGHFAKLSPAAAKHMKELIDKHTAEAES